MEEFERGEGENLLRANHDSSVSDGFSCLHIHGGVMG